MMTGDADPEYIGHALRRDVGHQRCDASSRSAIVSARSASTTSRSMTSRRTRSRRCRGLYDWLGEELTPATVDAMGRLVEGATKQNDSTRNHIATAPRTSASTPTSSRSASPTTAERFPDREQEEHGMTIDLTGGLEPEQDYVLATAPYNPDMRQGMSIWVSNDDPEQGFGFPRLGLEVVGIRVGSIPGYSFQVGLARRAGAHQKGQSSGELCAAGTGGVRDGDGCGGPFEMRCVDPFRRWIVSYDGSGARHDRRRPGGNGTVDRVAYGRRRAAPRDGDGGAALDPGHDGRSGQGADDPAIPSRPRSWAGGASSSSPGGLYRLRVRAWDEQSLQLHGLADLPPGRARHDRLLGTLLAVGAVSEPQGVRLHRVPAPETGGPPTYAECLPLRRRRRPHPRDARRRARG